MAVRRKSVEVVDEPAVSSAAPHQVEDHDDVRELEDALRIDEHALEEGLCAQPELFYRVSKAYALETSRRDAAKQALADAEAAADIAIRREAQDNNRKITESEVRALVLLSRDVARARERLNVFSESSALLASLKEAFQQRSYALKDLAGLYVANYYSASPHSPGTLAQREASAGIARTRMNEARREGSGGSR